VNSTTVAEQLCQLVSSITAKPIQAEAEMDVPLRDLGLSSLRMIQLIGDLESTFQIRINDDDVDEENFGTLSGLIQFVEEKTKS